MSDEDNSTYFTNEISLPRTIRFWLLLCSEIPSLLCSIFILHHFFTHPNERRALKNHIVILLNMINFIFLSVDVPLYLNFIRIGKVWPSTAAHCLIWWFVDLGFFQTCCLLTALGSIQRHILVFHSTWVANRKQRLFVHYLPLILILLYASIYYIWVIFFPPCNDTYDYSLPVCGAAPCHLSVPILGIWESGIHGCLVTVIISIFSIGLAIRVIIHRRLHQQPIQWRKHRKMTFQMLSISLAFMIFNLPISVMFVAYAFGLPSYIGVEVQLYFFFITYWLLFLLPFLCLNSIPNRKQKLFRLLGISNHHQATVGVAVENNR